MKYSTLSTYFDDLKDYINKNTGIQFPVYHGDFFPYADNEDSYWTVCGSINASNVHRDIILQDLF